MAVAEVSKQQDSEESQADYKWTGHREWTL